jgi:hypothetical protein
VRHSAVNPFYNAKKAIRTSTVRYSGLDQLEVPGLGLPTRTRESIVSTECTEIPSQKYRNYSGYSTLNSLYLSEQQRPVGLQLPIIIKI